MNWEPAMTQSQATPAHLPGLALCVGSSIGEGMPLSTIHPFSGAASSLRPHEVPSLPGSLWLVSPLRVFPSVLSSTGPLQPSKEAEKSGCAGGRAGMHAAQGIPPPLTAKAWYLSKEAVRGKGLHLKN